jgi:hypothetical protein
MCSLNSHRSTASTIAALVVGMLCVRAQAAADGWETFHGTARPAGQNCSAPHDRNPDLRRADNRRLRLPAGFSRKIEVYGHFIDDPRFVAKVYGTGTANRGGGVGGAVNSARGCGNIGSVLVNINVPAESGSASPELRIGVGGDDWHARIPVEIVTLSVKGVGWAAETLRGGSTFLAAGVRPPPPGPIGPPLETRRLVGSSAGGCSGNNCPQSAGSAVAPDGPGAGAISTVGNDLPDAIGGCIDDIGGSARIDGNLLTLNMPADRRAVSVMACLRRPMILEYKVHFPDLDTGAVGFDQTSGVPLKAPTPHVAPPQLTGPTLPAGEDRFRLFRFTDEFLANATGTQRINIVGPGNISTQTLTIVVRTGR